MDKLICDYSDYLVNNNKSKHTVQAYLRDILNFNDYVKGNLLSVTNRQIREYTEHLLKNYMSESTKNRVIFSIRNFYNYLISIGKIKVNPTNEIKVFKNNERNPDILTKNEIVKFLSLVKGEKTKDNRDRVLLQFMYETGVKVSELITIRVEDINFDIGILAVKSNGKTRTIPLYDDILKSLENYIVNIRPILNKENRNELFLNMNGSSISRQGVWKIINRYSEQFEIDKTITPNTLRHSLAIHLLENGADAKYVKDIMGFHELSSMLFYTNYIKETRRDYFAKYHKL